MDVLSALRLLTQFNPPRSMGGPVPWFDLAEIAVNNGVAPLIAYNLEYKIGGAGAPSDVRDRLLGIYQGSLSDNVFKLVNLRRLLGEVDDLQAVLLEAAAYADSLYPHVAFRPVPDLRVMVRKEDVPKLVDAGRPMGFKLESEAEGVVALSDNRTRFLFFSEMFGENGFESVYERGVSAKAYGRLVRRPSIEDALLTHMSLLGQSGFEAALIEFIDLREIILGAPNQSASWDTPPDPEVVLERAEQLGVSRALYCAMTLLSEFYPEVKSQADALTPDVGMAMRAVLNKLVVEPSRDLGRQTVNRAAEQIRKVLMGRA